MYPAVNKKNRENNPRSTQQIDLDKKSWLDEKENVLLCL
jgi:hypothetical protein